MRVTLKELKSLIREEVVKQQNTSSTSTKQITYEEMLKLINDLNLPEKRFQHILDVLKQQNN